MAAFISLMGSSDKDTRIVSPIPSLINIPSPMADRIDPVYVVPASVIPICNG